MLGDVDATCIVVGVHKQCYTIIILLSDTRRGGKRRRWRRRKCRSTNFGCWRSAILGEKNPMTWLLWEMAASSLTIDCIESKSVKCSTLEHGISHSSPKHDSLVGRIQCVVLYYYCVHDNDNYGPFGLSQLQSYTCIECLTWQYWLIASSLASATLATWLRPKNIRSTVIMVT